MPVLFLFILAQGSQRALLVDSSEYRRAHFRSFFLSSCKDKVCGCHSGSQAAMPRALYDYSCRDVLSPECYSHLFKWKQK
ncbi:hypothetical protein B0J12DRAFT_671971 [Macrophomina phaseolina]|uniref:Uncharacterized protein n=1 Tax=Macrophomina phaseolina TaxID=35725 RepID=A0ABQ8G3I1_9PEZI|nr:hypothetical protein B0J12DRAFT_671971 [Macrophomina phaseolina]